MPHGGTPSADAYTSLSETHPTLHPVVHSPSKLLHIGHIRPILPTTIHWHREALWDAAQYLPHVSIQVLCQFRVILKFEVYRIMHLKNRLHVAALSPIGANDFLPNGHFRLLHEPCESLLDGGGKRESFSLGPYRRIPRLNAPNITNATTKAPNVSIPLRLRDHTGFISWNPHVERVGLINPSLGVIFADVYAILP